MTPARGANHESLVIRHWLYGDEPSPLVSSRFPVSPTGRHGPELPVSSRALEPVGSWLGGTINEQTVGDRLAPIDPRTGREIGDDMAISRRLEAAEALFQAAKKREQAAKKREPSARNE